MTAKSQLMINIFTYDLTWVGFVDTIKSFVHRTSWNQIVYSELVVNKNAEYIQELQTGRILVVNDQRYKALIIQEIESNLDEPFVSYNCMALKGIMNYRIANPKFVRTFDNQKQSNVMSTLVDKNCVNQSLDNDRKFWDSTVTKNMLTVAPLRNVGDTIDYDIDWDSGELGDVLTEISNMYDEQAGGAKYPLGWNIYINPGYDGYTFDVYYGTHRESKQSLVPAVVFSEDFGNIKNVYYQKSTKDMKTTVYATYNDGTKDTYTKWSTDRYGYPRSFNRRETVMDSTQKFAYKVIKEASKELNDYMIIDTFEAEIINSKDTMSALNVDWFLGDIVTIQSKNIIPNKLINIDAQVTELEETYDENDYSLGVTFGKGYVSFIGLIKKAIKSKKSNKNNDVNPDL